MIEYDKDAIVPPYITEYLRAKTVHNDEFMHSLENNAGRKQCSDSRA